MSNRPVFFFCVSVRIEGKHGFRMFLPIPLGILRSLSDMAEDIGYIWRLFKGKKKETPPSAQARDPIRNVYHGQNQTPERRIGESVIDFFSSPSPEMLLAACRLVQNLLREITFHWGSEDLADIDLQTEEDRVRVRCFFR